MNEEAVGMEDDAVMKALFLCLSFSFLHVAASPQECIFQTPTEFVRHANEAGGYALEVPKGWQVKQVKEDIYSRNSKTDSCLSATTDVVVEGLEREVTVDAYLNQTLALVGRILSNWTESERTDATLGGLPAKKSVYTYTWGNAKWKVVLYVTVKGRKFYALQCATRADLFDQHQSAFERVVRSFTFKK